MKKLAILVITLTASYTFAQEVPTKTLPTKEKMTVEQRVELQTKRLTLDLDLNQKQQDEIKSLLKKEAKEMEVTREKMKPNKSEGEKLSADEKFNIQSKSLDKQIAMKAEMKKILTTEQYTKWEAKQKNRKGQLKGKLGERKETPKNKK